MCVLDLKKACAILMQSFEVQHGSNLLSVELLWLHLSYVTV